MIPASAFSPRAIEVQEYSALACPTCHPCTRPTGQVFLSVRMPSMLSDEEQQDPLLPDDEESCAESIHSLPLKRLRSHGDTDSEVSGSFTGRVHRTCSKRAHSALLVLTCTVLVAWLASVSRHSKLKTDGESFQSVARFAEDDDGAVRPRVYVYQLPAVFNYDLLRCHYNSTMEELNHGYGKHDGTLLGMDLYRTDQRFLEPIVHGRLLASKHGQVVADPEQADLFYVPYYPYIAFLCLREVAKPYTPKTLLPFLGQDAQKLDDALWVELHKSPWLRRRNGTDHIAVAGAIGTEITEPVGFGSNFGREAGVRNWVIGALEGTQITAAHPTSRIVPIPYPSGLHCTAPSHCGGAAGSAAITRGIFALFIGDPDRSPVRSDIVANLQKFPAKTVVADPKFTEGFLRNNRDFFKLMVNATFCLEPGGDSPTRKGFYDAVLAGCIPVIFDEAFFGNLPFAGLLQRPFKDFGLIIPDAKRTVESLMGISPHKITALREGLRQVAWQLNYASPTANGTRGDAIDNFIREVALVRSDRLVSK